MLCGNRETVFAFLPAGGYRLTLCRCGRPLCQLLVRLVPGGNAEIMLDPARRCYGWRQDRMHSLYNADDGALRT